MNGELKEQLHKPSPYSIVRCPGCYTPLRVTDSQQADDVIEEHTAYGCRRPDPLVQARLTEERIEQAQGKRPRRRNERTK